jgi:site-specific DNA recombinase
MRVPALSEVGTANDFEAVWKSLDMDRKRAVIDVLMTIRVHPPGKGTRRFDPSTVEVAWKTPA